MSNDTKEFSEKQRTILVVDDEPSTRQLLSTILHKDGYRVLEAGDGVEALEVLRETPADMIITDVAMPRMGGWELLGQIRKVSQGLPVLLITGYLSEEAENLLKDRQASGYLTKPVRADELLSQVRNLLRPAKLKRKPRVLVVCADQECIDLLNSLLARVGCETLVLDNGQEALSKMEEVQPDLIVLDVSTQETRGFEVCGALRSSSATANIPVILLSAVASREDVLRGVKLGVDAYIVKPIDQKRLLIDVVRSLRKVGKM